MLSRSGDSMGVAFVSWINSQLRERMEEGSIVELPAPADLQDHTPVHDELTELGAA